MSLPARAVLLGASGLLLLGQTGCMVPYPAYRQAQLRSYSLYQQKMLAESRSGQLEQQLAQSQAQLGTYQQRLDNLKNGMARLKEHNLSLLERLKNSRNPLDSNSTQRLKDLAGQFKNFEFDPETGVSKFHSDILFDLGSDRIKPDGRRLLQEFASIMNEGSAKKLNVLVVGHTDDHRIAHSSTRQKHPTNWHLSTDRADAVVLALSKYGMSQKRLGAAGYSMFQPVAPNDNDRNRQLNRRVEIYVLAPGAAVAGQWHDRHRR